MGFADGNCEKEGGHVNVAYNADCMEVMRRYPDGYFDLAIVDPVYGDVRKGGYMNGSGGGLAKQKDYHAAIWQQDKTGVDYFEELFRVSKNQIIWGGNYFAEEIGRNSPCWIVWNKDHPEGVNYADCELAWTSFTCSAKLFTYRWNGFIQQDMKNREQRIHPTQKPIALYRWIYRRFEIPNGSKILDTHLGSGTHRRAAYDYGMDFVGCEIDPIYFELQERAFEEYTSQMRMEGMV